jgi:hypothetical protein
VSPEQILAIGGAVATVISPIVSAIVYQAKRAKAHESRLESGNKAFGDLKNQLASVEERLRKVELNEALRTPPPP